MLKRLVITVAIALTAPLSANADVLVTGHVTQLEASYLPNAAGFLMDAGYSGCPAGTYLQWRGPNNDGNPNVVPYGFDMLIAAVANGTRVEVSFSSGCTVHFLYILPEVNSSVNAVSAGNQNTNGGNISIGH